MTENTTEDVETTTCEDCGDEIDADTSRCGDCDYNYASCADCGDETNIDDLNPTQHDESVCDDCLSNHYFGCNDCNQQVHHDYSCTVDDEYSVCETCRDYNYTYCDRCDTYHHDNNGCEEDGCDCTSPDQRFSMRHDTDRVDNDTSARVTLPAGFVSDEGMGEIARLIRSAAPAIDYNLIGEAFGAAVTEANLWNTIAYSFGDAIGNEWQTGQGNFTKRLSRYAYKTNGTKLPPAILSQIGNIGAQHSGGVDFDVEFTRDLNQSASDFGHEDSCWWQSYYESRCTLKSNGGIGMRVFAESTYSVSDYVPGPWLHAATFDPITGMPMIYTNTGRTRSVRDVQGRAWVMPLRRTDAGSLTPTFDTENATAYVVFNGYGDLSGYAGARIMAHMNGMTYRKISFTGGVMYVNSDAGYLVGPESLVEAYTDGSLHLDLPQHATLYNSENRTHANA